MYSDYNMIKNILVNFIYIRKVEEESAGIKEEIALKLYSTKYISRFCN